MNTADARFGGIARLFTTPGLDRLRNSRVCVVGLGGVGSWAAEALARSGVGALTLVDMDDICVGNVNRQLHALEGEFGKSKVEVIATRIHAINPACNVQPIQAFFLRSNAREILSAGFDFVLDAIDSPSKKCLLIDLCRASEIPVVMVGSSGGRRDPTLIRVNDLASVTHDRLAQEVRKKLRVRHSFPRGGEPFNVACVYSLEAPVYPGTNGSVCAARDAAADLRLDCNSGYGTASFVTGTFGLVAAGHIVQRLATDHTVARTSSEASSSNDCN